MNSDFEDDRTAVNVCHYRTKSVMHSYSILFYHYFFVNLNY